MSQEGTHKIFVVEDDEWYRELLLYNIGLNPDFEVQGFPDGNSCLNAMYLRPAVITLDFSLPDINGLTLLKRLRENYPDTEVIIISEQKDIETAVELLKHGAYDYFVKDPDIRERLHNTLNHILRNRALKGEVEKLREEVGQKYQFQKSMIGNSPVMKKVFRLMEKAATSNITVYLTGETGTGKEVAAKAIHYNSSRKGEPFVPVNMAAIPKDLIESELFGHEKGAFTGAATRRKGKFEEAHNGTIFLDEIAELDLSLQAKLLRALQEKEIIRLGSNKQIAIDCRIIIATHRNLFEEVQAGRFREDLYYRLMGLRIELPPLREREGDIILVAKHFLKNVCKENDWPPKQLDKAAAKAILKHPWQGNIRELKSVIDLAATLSDGDWITPDDLQLQQGSGLSAVTSGNLTMKEHTHRIIFSLLDKHDGNVIKVAEILDIGKSTIYRLLKEEKEEES